MGEITSEVKRQALWDDDVIHHSAELEDRVRSADHKEASEIRRDLERTRVDLDNTVRNLRRRVELSELATDAFESTKGFVIEKQPDIMGMVKRNPAPMALLAGALGWMVYRGKQEPEEEITGEDFGEQGLGAMEKMKEKGSHMLSSMKHKAASTMHSIREKSSEKMDSKRKNLWIHKLN